MISRVIFDAPKILIFLFLSFQQLFSGYVIFIIGEMLKGKSYDSFLYLCAMLLFSSFIRFCVFYYTSNYAAKSLYTLRNRVFACLMNQPISYIDSMRKGDFVRMVSEETRADFSHLNSQAGLFSNGVMGLILLSISFYTSWRITIICLLFSICVYFESRRVGRVIEKLSNLVSQCSKEIVRMCDEQLDFLHELKLLGGVEYVVSEFNKVSESADKMERKSRLVIEGQSCIIYGMGIIAIWFLLMYNKKFSVLEFESFLFLLGVYYKLLQSAVAASQNWINMKSVYPYVKSVEKFLEIRMSKMDKFAVQNND